MGNPDVLPKDPIPVIDFYSGELLKQIFDGLAIYRFRHGDVEFLKAQLQTIGNNERLFGGFIAGEKLKPLFLTEKGLFTVPCPDTARKVDHLSKTLS
jgi:hypothetical protein